MIGFDRHLGGFGAKLDEHDLAVDLQGFTSLSQHLIGSTPVKEKLPTVLQPKPVTIIVSVPMLSSKVSVPPLPFQIVVTAPAWLRSSHPSPDVRTERSMIDGCWQ